MCSPSVYECVCECVRVCTGVKMHEKIADLRNLRGISHGHGHLLNINPEAMQEQRNDHELETNVSKEHS